jgi:hypothetical protein
MPQSYEHASTWIEAIEFRRQPLFGQCQLFLISVKNNWHSTPLTDLLPSCDIYHQNSLSFSLRKPARNSMVPCTGRGLLHMNSLSNARLILVLSSLNINEESHQTAHL